MSLQRQHFRHPARQTGALPTELTSRRLSPVSNGVLFSLRSRFPTYPLGYLLFIYLFTSFCGYRPKSHARCHPFPIPQTVEVGHTTGVYDPYSFRIVRWVLLRPARINQWKCCETGSTVFRPFPRRLKSLTICRCHYKGSTFNLPLSRPALSQLN